MARARRIRTKFSWRRVYLHGALLLGGALEGKSSCLVIYDTHPDGSARDLMATLRGRRLYRLAKAIVRQFEEVGDE